MKIRCAIATCNNETIIQEMDDEHGYHGFQLAERWTVAHMKGYLATDGSDRFEFRCPKHPYLGGIPAVDEDKR